MASDLGPGKGGNNDNMHGNKQPFVQSTNLKSIILVSFKYYIFMINLAWNDI